VWVVVGGGGGLLSLEEFMNRGGPIANVMRALALVPRKLKTILLCEWYS